VHYKCLIDDDDDYILHRFQVMADYWSNFRQRSGVLLFNAPAGVIPCEYPDKHYLSRN